MTWSLLAGTICLMRSTRRSGAGHCQWVLADGCLDFNQWSIIPHFLQGTEPNKAAHALAPIDTQPVSWGEATGAWRFYPILSYRWTRETFRTLATWMPSCNPFWGPKSTVKQITSELIHALIWFSKGSHQPLQCGLGAIKWLGPSPAQGRGHRPWLAGGTWSHFSYICSSTPNFKWLFRNKQLKVQTDKQCFHLSLSLVGISMVKLELTGALFASKDLLLQVPTASDASKEAHRGMCGAG